MVSEPKVLTESTEPMMSPEPMVSMVSRWIEDVHMLVPQLTENNYAMWSVEMKALLEEQDLWKIVKDGDTRPDTTGYTRSQQKTWRAPFTQNNIAILTIYYAIEGTCCSREIGDMRKTKEAWELLEKVYKVADSSNEVQPQKQGELETTKEDEKNAEGEPVREEVARNVESKLDKDQAEPVVEKKEVEPPLKPEMGKEEGESSKMKADGDEEEELYPKAEEPVEEEKKKGVPNEGELEKEEAVEETPPRQPPEKVEEIDVRTSENTDEMKNAVDDDMHTSSDEATDKFHEADEKTTEKYDTVAENAIDAGEDTRKNQHQDINLGGSSDYHCETEDDSKENLVMKSPFSQFFSYPQFSCNSNNNNNQHLGSKYTSQSKAAIADIEVTLIETHANIRILSQRRVRQLSKMVASFQSVLLNVLHLNVVTTFDSRVLYSISAKVEEGCQLSSADDIATTVHHMLRIIEEETNILYTSQS